MNQSQAKRTAAAPRAGPFYFSYSRAMILDPAVGELCTAASCFFFFVADWKSFGVGDL
jgi:hypothetical protein